MNHKYGLLIYEAAMNVSNKFDIVTVQGEYFWPNKILGITNPKSGETRIIFDPLKTVTMIIVEDSEWSKVQDDAINNAVKAWNTANPQNQTGTMKVIFGLNDLNLIGEQLKKRIKELMSK